MTIRIDPVIDGVRATKQLDLLSFGIVMHRSRRWIQPRGTNCPTSHERDLVPVPGMIDRDSKRLIDATTRPSIDDEQRTSGRAADECTQPKSRHRPTGAMPADHERRRRGHARSDGDPTPEALEQARMLDCSIDPAFDVDDRGPRRSRRLRAMRRDAYRHDPPGQS
jgi:hypothetical protein